MMPLRGLGKALNAFALVLCGLIGTVMSAGFVALLCFIAYAAFGNLFGVR